MHTLAPLPKKRRKEFACLFSDSDESDASTVDETPKGMDHALKEREGSKEVPRKGSYSQRGKAAGALSEVFIKPIHVFNQIELF